MKKYLTIAAGLLTCASLMLTAAPALAHSDVNVGINVGIPGIHLEPVYVEPHVVYTQPHPLYIEQGPVYYQGQHWEGQEYHGRHGGYREDRGRHGENRGHGRGRHGRD